MIHYISEIERKERNRINWTRVHLEADRRRPFALQHIPTKLDLTSRKELI